MSGSPTDESTIVSQRLIDATPERLFEAFSDPAQIAVWWGPEGFTNTFEEFDFQPGGVWRFVMHGPDGINYPNESEFVEITSPSRIVFNHLGTIHKFRMTMTFAPEGGKTLLTWQMRFDPPAEDAKLREFILGANQQNFDRLEDYLLKSI